MADEELIPSLCIVPVIGMHDDGRIGRFLGTSAFVVEDHLLLTCAHVLKPWSGRFAVTAEEEHEPKLYSAEPIAVDEKRDLALLKVDDYKPPRPLALADDSEIAQNKIVCCFEYGTTVPAGGTIDFSPATRLGNVTRIRNLTSRYGAAGAYMLELSFPALRGASGAPVLGWEPPFPIWGVVTANVSYELLPVQVENIVDEKGQVTEETRFHLPQALAIHVRVIREFLAAAPRKSGG